LKIPSFFYRGEDEDLPTIRSEFAFHQFRKALQDYAYKLACDAISDPDVHGRILIKTFGTRMEEVDTDEFHIRFYAKHAYFGRHVKHGDSWSFDVEEKEYTDSNHSSKIHFDCYPAEKQAKTRETIMEFINKLLSGVKPEPRFSLAKQVAR
jgi:hypothetical protein